MGIWMRTAAAGLIAAVSLIWGWSLTAAWEHMPAEWLCDYGQTPVVRGERGGKRNRKRMILLSAAGCGCYTVLLTWDMLSDCGLLSEWSLLPEWGFLLEGSGQMQARVSAMAFFWTFSALAAVWALGLVFLADRKYQIIPDQMLWIIGAVGVMRALAEGWSETRLLRFAAAAAAARAVAGLACMGLFILLGKGAELLVRIKDSVFLKKKNQEPFCGFGMGDVKFIFAIGVLLGMDDGLAALTYASLFCALCVGTLLLTGKLTASSTHPFGPYLCAVTAAVLLAQNAAVS